MEDCKIQFYFSIRSKNLVKGYISTTPAQREYLPNTSLNVNKYCNVLILILLLHLKKSRGGIFFIFFVCFISLVSLVCSIFFKGGIGGVRASCEELLIFQVQNCLQNLMPLFINKHVES